MLAGVFYLILLLWGAGDLVVHRLALGKIQREISLIEAPAAEARAETDRWHILRSSVDPDTYALDLLAAVAAPTDGGKVRLTRFSLDGGRIQISGEATDVTQAYGFIEQLKKSPVLQEYEWNAAQPQLAGKNSVRFDMEGNRPDTNHETPGP
jgi:Tfp pilus assembly protein PilN